MVDLDQGFVGVEMYLDLFLQAGGRFDVLQGGEAIPFEGDGYGRVIRQIGAGRLLGSVPEAVTAIKVEVTHARAFDGAIRQVGENIPFLSILERDDTRPKRLGDQEGQDAVR
jgi:hypothetical protein